MEPLVCARRGAGQVWKARNAYCEAVLCYDQRFDLNGKPVEQIVSEEARQQARRCLAARAARLRDRQQQADACPPELSPGVVNSGESSRAA
jgi:sRNA-binding protein